MSRSLSSGDLAIHVSLVCTESLLPHEMTQADRLSKLLREIREDGFLRVPILVDAKTGTVLDGHHRLEALRRLGAHLVPAALVDYDSPDVSVTPRRVDVPVSKAEVRRAAISGELMPPKTTRHALPIDPPELDVPLRDLMLGRCEE